MKKENIWRRKENFEKKNGEGKGGKYFEKKNIILTRGKKRKENEDNFWAEEKKNGEGEEEKIWRRKRFGEGKYLFCGGEGKYLEEKKNRRRRKTFGEGRYCFS